MNRDVVLIEAVLFVAMFIAAPLALAQGQEPSPYALSIPEFFEGTPDCAGVHSGSHEGDTRVQPVVGKGSAYLLLYVAGPDGDGTKVFLGLTPRGCVPAQVSALPILAHPAIRMLLFGEDATEEPVLP